MTSSTHLGWVSVFVIGVGIGALASRSAPIAFAQDHSLTVSGSCSSGDLVVATKDGFRCSPVVSVVSYPVCSDGQFLTAGSDGYLRCSGAPTSSYSASGLLPSCQSGSTLVSTGYGSWSCN